MTDLTWALLRSRYLIRDRWLTLRADTYRMPDGGVVSPYYVLEYHSWVCVVALTHDLQVVLVRQFRPGVGKATLELPGGTADAADSSPLETARRELLEETGYASESFVEIGRVYPNPATHTNTEYCYLATDIVAAGVPQRDEFEQMDVVLLPLGEVVSLAQRGELSHAAHVAALFFALETLRAGERAPEALLQARDS